MTLSTTSNKVSFSGNGNTTVFAYNFKILASSDLKVYIRSATGTETLKTITTHYNVSGVGSASGGNVTFTGGNTPANGETVIIQRVVPLTQTHDYVENDPFPAESHEEGLDRLTMHVQQIQEEVDRSIKASVTNTITSPEFSNSPTDRANKIFGFDSAGDISVTTNIGTNRGNWASGTDYNERDLVKDTSTNNVFQVNSTHTSSGSQPLTTNANASKYDLLVDSESASASATASQNSAVASQNSATASQNSATASATSEANALSHSNTASNHVATALGHSNTAGTHATNSSNSATASSNSATASALNLTNFEKQYLGSKSSAPTTDNDGVTLDASYEGTLYFNSSNDELYVWSGSAWGQASFSAGGFLSQNNNLSDVANVSTSRTNLGLGTASTLNVGTSANNIPQLDGNAKLPAVDGSNLTGLSSGTDAINMTIASGSDAISVGNVVTRESNGETAKVKKTTTTSNLTLGQATVNQAMPSHAYSFASSSSSYYAQYPGHSDGIANDSGKYVIVYRAGSHTRIQIFDYDSASSTWSRTGGVSGVSEENRSLSSPDSTYTSGPAFQGAGGNFNGDASLFYLRWHKNMNASAGGTWMIIWHYSQSAGNMNRYVTPMTIDSNNHVTLYTRQPIIQAPNGMPNATSQAYFTTDTSVISMETDKATFVTAGQHYVYWSHPYASYYVIATCEVTWTGSNYTQNYTSKQYFTSINGNNSQNQSQPRPTRVMYDYTTGRLGTFWLDNNRRNRFTVWENTGTSSSPTWTPQYTEQLTTDNNNGTFDNNAQWYSQFQKADGKGRVLFSYRHTYYSPSTTYGAKWLAISMGASSLTIQTVINHGSNNSQFHPAPVQSFHYDYLNDVYIVPSSHNLHQVGQGQHMRIYSPDGTGITQSSAVSGGGNSNAYQWGRSLAIVDTMSISSINSANAGKWLQINDTDTSTYSSLSANGQNSYYSAGNIPHTLTTNSTNKALAFGFAQKGGTAGNTISVLPFDSESIEQNQTSLTHGTKYFVTSTGALSTATTPDASIYNDPDNPFVGQAIHTTNLRLPSKEVAGSSGALADTSRVFCGAVDFRRDSGVTSGVIIGLPSGIDKADVRGYHIMGFGVASDTSSEIRIKPYHSGSSVLSGNNWRTHNFVTYGGNSYQARSHDWSSYFKFDFYNQTPYVDQSPVQTYIGNAHSPRLNFDLRWENNIQNPGYMYWATTRTSGNQNQIFVDHGVGGSDANNVTTNYASQFYFYPDTGSMAEGVISVYAIIKS